MSSLPSQIQKQTNDADRLIKARTRYLNNNPRSGRPMKSKQKVGPVPIITGTKDELTIVWHILLKAVGAKARGNKRWGNLALYIDLIEYFIELRKRGIALPRRYLPFKACSENLALILARHGYLPKSELLNNPLGNQKTRDDISKALDNVFIRIADAIGNTPYNNR